MLALYRRAESAPPYRSPLLRQPGGFEGLGSGEEAPKPSRLAVPPLDHSAEGRLGLGSACLATGAEPTDRDESIAEVADLRQFQADVGERLVDCPAHRPLSIPLGAGGA